MRKSIILALVSLWLPLILSGQSSFSANRPGQIDNPDITPAGNIMLESGLHFGFANRADLLPTSSIRFGINSNIELSMNADNIRTIGLANFNIGSKLAICGEKGLLPKISLVTSVYLPFLGADEARPSHMGMQMQIAASHSIGSKVTVHTNIGATYDGNLSYPVYNYVLSLYFSPFNRVWAFTEVYGYFSDEEASTNAFDLGLTWQALRNLQLDITYGPAWGDFPSNNFVQIGAAFQIESKRNRQ